MTRTEGMGRWMESPFCQAERERLKRRSENEVHPPRFASSDPRPWDAHYSRAIFLHRHGDFAEAEAEYLLALDRCRGRAEIVHDLECLLAVCRAQRTK